MNKKVMSALALGVLLCSGVALAQNRNIDQSQVDFRLGPPNFGPMGGAGQTCATVGLPFGASPPSVANTITIAGAAGTVSGLEVELQVAHTWVGDVVATLAHGPSSTLIDQPGVPASACGCANDDIDVTLSDAGAPSVEGVCAAAVPTISGTLSPFPGTLATFNGADPNGGWTMTVADAVAAFDNGSFNSWCINITGAGTGGATGGATGGGATGGTSTPATSVWGVIALIALFLGVSLFFLRRRSSVSA